MPRFANGSPPVRGHKLRQGSTHSLNEEDRRSQLLFKVSRHLAGGNMKMDTMYLVRKIKSLKDRQFRVQKATTLLAMIGLGLGIYVDESCFLGYVPLPEEELTGDYVNPLPPDLKSSSCKDGKERVPLEVAKTIVSITTCMLCVSIVYYNKLFIRIREAILFYVHVRTGTPNPDAAAAKGREQRARRQMIRAGLELLFSLPHCAPGYSRIFVVGVLGRPAYYRFESIIVIFMFFRFYHVFILFRKWLFREYIEDAAFQLGDEDALHTIFNPADPMGGKLALKVALKRHPIKMIGGATCFIIVTTAYCVRVAEASANSLQTYFWNQLWMVLVTMTTTGYGDMYPVTHFGRFVCVIVMICGSIITALMTAAAAGYLDLTQTEDKVMRIMQVERIRAKLVLASVVVLQLIWRRNTKRMGQDDFAARFLDAKANFKQAVEDFSDFRNEHPELFGRTEDTKHAAGGGQPDEASPLFNKNGRRSSIVRSVLASLEGAKDLGSRRPNGRFDMPERDEGTSSISKAERVVQPPPASSGIENVGEQALRAIVREEIWSSGGGGVGGGAGGGMPARQVEDFERRFEEMERKIADLCAKVEKVLETRQDFGQLVTKAAESRGAGTGNLNHVARPADAEMLTSHAGKSNGDIITVAGEQSMPSKRNTTPTRAATRPPHPPRPRRQGSNGLPGRGAEGEGPGPAVSDSGFGAGRGGRSSSADRAGLPPHQSDGAAGPRRGRPDEDKIQRQRWAWKGKNLREKELGRSPLTPQVLLDDERGGGRQHNSWHGASPSGGSPHTPLSQRGRSSYLSEEEVGRLASEAIAPFRDKWERRKGASPGRPSPKAASGSSVISWVHRPIAAAEQPTPPVFPDLLGDNVDKMMRTGQRLRGMGQHDAALETFDAALRRQPSNADLLCSKALVLQHDKRQPDAAEALYREALRGRPGHVESLCGLGVLLIAQGEFAAAEQALRQALQRDPKHVESLTYLAGMMQDGVHSGGRNEQQAEAHYLAALKLSPNHQAAQQGLALLRQAMGKAPHIESRYA